MKILLVFLAVAMAATVAALVFGWLLLQVFGLLAVFIVVVLMVLRDRESTP